ncbi:syntaxin-1A isoform X1 [Wyeomyia smithii]|uniref:syntaxin-1A isoform X1 n=1 Tax=Wyeomyia smithii TaxID=174621 RepID=UPI0024681103|nr:syntaxin-1A isoform X1 [Wyeomyia smithii]
MTRDRLGELLEVRGIVKSIVKSRQYSNLNFQKSTYKDFEYEFVQEHEFWTLYNQERILEDLDRFSDIAGWIRNLKQNILKIEVNIFSEGFTKVGCELKKNADLCYRIYTAVIQMQVELQNQQWRKEEEIVSRVRSVQFQRIKEAYLQTYWKYQSVVQRFEDSITKNCILYFNESCEECAPSESLLQPESAVSRETLEEAQNTLNAIEDRHRDLLMLERSLEQMRDLFVLFSTLLMEHGSLLAGIESNVQNASNQVATAVQQLGAARRYQWKAADRSCFCFNRMGLMLIVLAMLTVIAVILIVKKIVL